jgi:hypothetical protein
MRNERAIERIDFALRDMAILLMRNLLKAKSYLGDCRDSISDGFSPLV